MRPILYESTETVFASNGLGALTDAISCKVTEERNGAFELKMEYPVSGIHYGDLTIRRIILAKPNQTDQAQPFRIYQITRPLGGVVTVNAEHISYDLSGYPVEPFVAYSAADALARLSTSAVTAPPFTFSTDLSANGKLEVDRPCSIRSLFDDKNIGMYGGEWKFDRFAVSLLARRGENRGVTIRYGKNLTSLSQEENCSNMYTAVMPYWIGGSSEERVYTSLPGKTVPVGTFDFTRILPLDLSSEFKEQPTGGELLIAAQKYISENALSVPKVSLKVGFAQLEQTEEYKGLALLERVNLCDYVTVIFPKLGVNATAECIKVVYDVLLDRVESVELGDAAQNIADTIAGTVAATAANTVNTTTAKQNAAAAQSSASAAKTRSDSVYSAAGSYAAAVDLGQILSSDSENSVLLEGKSLSINGEAHSLQWTNINGVYHLTGA